MTTSATAFMRWRSRSNPATRCISTSRCMSRRMASATTEPMPSSSGTAATSRIGIGCLLSAISGIASSMVPEFEGSMDSPDGPPFHRSTTPRRAGSESAATRSPSRRSWGRAGIRSRLRRGCSAARGRKAGDATSITSRMYPSTISMVCSPPGTRCTKNSGTLRRAQGRPSRFRSSITLGMPGIWAAWWRAYAPRSITTPGSLVPTHTAISG